MKNLAAEHVKLGFIGLGNMGSRIAQRLLAHGYKLVVFDQNPTRAEALAPNGAVSVNDIVELARSADVILSCLTNDGAVQSVYTDPKGVLAGARPGTVVLEMSTVSPETSRELHKQAGRLGIDVHHIDTKPPSLFVQFPRGFGRDRAHFQHHGSRTRSREDPLGICINALHGSVVGKTGKNHICAACQFDDIVHGYSTIWCQSFCPSRILIEYDELVSMGKQTLRDPASHVAQANESEFYVFCSKILHIISFLRRSEN